jgi:hypothetical protein
MSARKGVAVLGFEQRMATEVVVAATAAVLAAARMQTAMSLGRHISA